MQQVKNWHRADIIAALKKQNLSLRRLSINSGLSPDTLRNALYRPYPKAEQIIAEALNISPNVIWGERYNK